MTKPAKDKLTQVLSDIHNHNCNITTREIFLHGFYGSGDEIEQGIDFRQATTFIKNLSILNLSNDNILVHLHSIGGDWNDGMAIYDSILTSPTFVTIIGYAAICSMSSIIIQAADKRILMPNCEFMVHFGTVSEETTSLAYISGAKTEEYRNIKMLKIYAEKCIEGKYFKNKKNTTIEKCMTYLSNKIKHKGDWWLTSDEALFYGFVDGIFGTPNYSTIEEIRGSTQT
jgi:ATP-dependent protease ClpP protease subunit